MANLFFIKFSSVAESGEVGEVLNRLKFQDFAWVSTRLSGKILITRQSGGTGMMPDYIRQHFSKFIETDSDGTGHFEPVELTGFCDEADENFIRLMSGEKNAVLFELDGEQFCLTPKGAWRLR